MTNQEAFDKVVAFLTKQNCRSMSVNGLYCAYRGIGGMKCAVGCLIPDDEYDPKMDGLGSLDIRSILKDFSIPSLNGIAVDLLESLQRVHDNVSPEYWQGKFEEVAHKFGLVFNG